MPSVVEFSELCGAGYEAQGNPTFRLIPPGSRLSWTPTPQPAPSPRSLPAVSYSASSRGSLPAPMAGRAGPACPVPDRDEVVTWSRSQAWSNRVGFYAAVFQREGSPSVLVFRGTDDLWDGLVDDVSIGLGGIPPQVLAALEVVRKTRLGSGAVLSGHSLGGALALIVAAHAGLAAVTFNAPGVLDSCVQSVRWTGGVGRFFAALARCVSNSRVRNVRINGDPVSSLFVTGLQAGASADSLPGAQCGLDVICRHGIATCIAAVRADAANYRELSL